MSQSAVKLCFLLQFYLSQNKTMINYCDWYRYLTINQKRKNDSNVKVHGETWTLTVNNSLFNRRSSSKRTRTTTQHCHLVESTRFATLSQTEHQTSTSLDRQLSSLRASPLIRIEYCGGAYKAFRYSPYLHNRSLPVTSGSTNCF